jgi:hypothetical protein
LLARKKAEQNKVVLVVDEAEKLRHAALERLLALAGDSRDDLEWTTIFIGRQELDQCLDQISLFGAAIGIDAEYALAELTRGETRQYLRFCFDAAEVREGQFADIFTDEAAADIFDKARGNLRLTNSLAREALAASCADTSCMIPLEEGGRPEERERKPSPFPWENRVLELYGLLRHNRIFSGSLVVAVAAAFVIGLLLTRGSSKEETPPAAPSSAPPVTAAAGIVPADVVPAQKTVPAEPQDGDKLFRERLAASASWLTGIQKGKYTIQLMLLESNQAQARVAAALAEDDFFPIREQLFIFRKRSNPPAVFVFHGLYDSLDAAREARNNMPVALRRHHPYPLAVDDAMKKLSN